MKKLWIIIGSIFGFIGLIVGLYFLEESYTEVILHGDKEVNVTVYTEYNDLGFDVTHNNHIIDKDKYTYKEVNNVDISKLGKYDVTYDIKYHLRHFHLARVVNVIDDVKPEITANLEKLERDYCTKKDKKKLEYTAKDNYDGDLTEKIAKTEEDELITLKVVDTSGNEESITIPIDYGKKPENYIKLNGNSTVYITVNGKYTESGANYYDGCGKKLDEKVMTSGNVDTKKIGTYTITYSVKDGKKATRKVVVSKAVSSSLNRTTISGSGNGKVIYLTFDDGPGPYTQKILNTLAKYNVKATFFVTYQAPGYAKYIKKAYDAGHAIGVHTYSHASNWSMYKSVDAYVSDFNKMNNVIKNQIGHTVKIFRFPGGSSNTVSRRWAKGVVKKIANYMTNAGYKYFDWDIGSGDTDGSGSRTKIYNNVINGAKSCKTCIVLMHDIKKNTANELDNILKTLTSKGYRFGTLSMSSPTVHHSIAN